MSARDFRSWLKDPYLYLLLVGIISLLIVELSSDFLAQLSKACTILSGVVGLALGLAIGASVGRITHRSWAEWASFLISAGASGVFTWYYLNSQIEQIAEQAGIWMFHVPIVVAALCIVGLFLGSRRRRD